MNDVVDSKTRSRMMANIRDRNTKPEIKIRQALHAKGFRYRLHDKKLPGKPDLVLPKYKAVIQINGCFWHGHSCPLFKWPSTRVEFWQNKIGGNIKRDQLNTEKLLEQGWRVLIWWECNTRNREVFEVSVEKAIMWLRRNESFLEIE
ncbi:very short patch repair endonuclease [Acinetobacter bereziniae]|uniref:very short patch repair endonuclease n=1 Tax=Acinetobacter bereziniae TaxID=106648 RepID=UPI003215917E